jgi:hypothetical protein
MVVTIDQAIEIHAKAALFRSGKSALKLTMDRAENCRARGDLKSFETWKSVGDKIAELETMGYLKQRKRA